MRKINEIDLRRRTASVLRAVERGQELIVTRDGDPVARIVPVVAPVKRQADPASGPAPVLPVEAVDDEEASKRVQVRPKKVAASSWATPDDVEALLERVKARREELARAMEAAEAARAEEAGQH
jgi:antitoxin (DNA-binding transcriptional repressor) of toxin-antitoxin stability system